MSAKGVVRTSIADIDYTGAKVTVAAHHKIDVDDLEDRCAYGLEVTLELQNPSGCRLHFVYGKVTSTLPGFDTRPTADWPGLHHVSLEADSRCPGFPDAREGSYASGEAFDPHAWFSGHAQVRDRQAAMSCAPAVTLGFASAPIRLGTVGAVALLQMNLEGLTLTGDLMSEGHTQAACHQDLACSATSPYAHESGAPGWCGIDDNCAAGHWYVGAQKCCPMGITNC